MRNGRSNFAQAIERAGDAPHDPDFLPGWYQTISGQITGCWIVGTFYTLIQPTPMYWADTQELQDAQQAAQS